MKTLEVDKEIEEVEKAEEADQVMTGEDYQKSKEIIFQI